MKPEQQSNYAEIPFSELFTHYVSDITMAVERIKVKDIRNDIQGINENIAKINSAIIGIMDAKLELEEK